jgi:heterogeneous nuclear rnp K-like protein 2
MDSPDKNYYLDKKRSFEEDEILPKKMKIQITMRCLMATKYAGLIIGKGGHQIAAIRDKANTKITLSQSVTHCADRIITTIGSPSNVSESYSLIALRLAEEEDSKEPVEQRKINLRFLIPNELMGAIIGKQAIKVKEIQAASNARVSASEGMLPDSTERKLTIIGNSEAIRKAVLMVCFNSC